jgi:hypothetical protein
MTLLIECLNIKQIKMIQRPLKKDFYSMFKFLLICPTSSLEKNYDPRNTGSMPAVKIFFRLEFDQIS